MIDQSSCGVAVESSVWEPVNGKAYQSAYNDEVVRWVPADTSTVLDLGCGSGGNAAYLSTRGFTVDGVTLSQAEARDAARWCRSVALHNLEHGLPDDLRGPYDTIVCSHVLEHICFPQKLLQDIHRRLNRGGKLILAVPNLLFYRNRLALLRGQFEYEQGGLMDETHFRWYTLTTLTRLLRAHHFDVEHEYGAGSLPLGPLRGPLPTLCRRLDSAACRALPGLFGWQLIVVATPR
jgi:2-polyprenyl-3-methyl-5-hydroxy-6-metoxy-1,4-benzoquinol methylase